MRRLLPLLCLTVGLVAAPSVAAVVGYGDIQLDPSYEATHWSDVWDLTACDLTLSYTIDLSGVSQTAAYETPYAEVGLREVGAGDFNPGPFGTYQGGAGG